MRSLILEKPFASISVQDVTLRATVNRATFYAHYKDKKELVASILEADLDAAVRTHFADHPALTRDSLIDFAVVIFEFLGIRHGDCPDNAKELQDMVGNTLQQAIHKIIEGWLSDRASHKRLFPGSSKQTAASVVSWSIYGEALRWSRRERRPAAVSVCREVIAILLPADGAAPLSSDARGNGVGESRGIGRLAV
jgi:AcrR family transcriptional regulator